MEIFFLIFGIFCGALFVWSLIPVAKKSPKEKIDVPIIVEFDDEKLRQICEETMQKWLDENWGVFGSEDEAPEWKQNFQRRWEEIE